MNPPQQQFMFPRGRGGFEIGPVYFHHGGGGHLALAWATFALVLLLVLTFGALLFARAGASRSGRWHRRMAFAGPPGMHGPHDPLEVLRIRYARGEIGRDEFLQGTTDLTGPAPPESG
jgi:uncharacterized membrane protein